MRLAILSDIHGNLAALEAVLDDIEARGTDAIINLGDCATGPLWPRETIELLSVIDMPTVRGNHDRLLSETPRDDMPRSMRFTYDSLSAEQKVALAALPTRVDLEGGIVAVHGTPNDDSAYLLHDKVAGRLALASRRSVAERIGDVAARLLLCGHSHHAQVASVGDCLVVNPGSVGCPRYADDDDAFISECGSPHARYAIAEERKGRWRVQLFALDYDWSVVAQQALANGRADFAAAFLGEKG
ncbi:MAG: metallophosphoesterase family protein [Gemmatimonadota bacterium]